MAFPCPPAEIIAHRGASAALPEHTFAAYDLALAQGADALELDVRATADGELVVLHDPTLLRTAGDPRAVAELPAAALAGLDAAVRPLRLTDVLDRYATATGWLVELKAPAPGWEDGAGDALAARGLASRAVVQSFDHDALRRLRRARPALAVAPLFERVPSARRLRTVARYGAAVGVRHTAVDLALVLRARACGLGVRAWTANEPDAVARLVGLGVDGVITDRPDVARVAADALTALPAAA